MISVRKLSEAATQILNRNQLSLEQIDLLVPHQANLNLLCALGKKLAIDENRILVNLDRYGNTSGASAFIALDEGLKSRGLKPGAKILILAFGAGFTWGAALLTRL